MYKTETLTIPDSLEQIVSGINRRWQIRIHGFPKLTIDESVEQLQLNQIVDDHLGDVAIDDGHLRCWWSVQDEQWCWLVRW